VLKLQVHGPIQPTEQGSVLNNFVTVTCYCRGLRMQWGGRPPLVGT
jgi:hypothetical protein